MKSILLVGPYPPPYGGIASHIVSLAPHLADAGYAVTVLTLTQGKDEAFRPHPGVEVLRVDARQSLFDSASVATAVRLGQRLRPRHAEWLAREVITTTVVKRVAREREAALIACYMITSGLFVPHLRRAFGARVKLMTTIFGELIERQDVILANRAFYRRILEESDQVLATSAYCAGLARVVDYDPRRVEVIYIGVDSDRFLPEAARPGLRTLPLPTGRRLLFVGRFHEEMGLDIVLDVIPDVIAERKEACFVLIGAHGPLSEKAASVRHTYPEHVFIHQDVPFDLIPAYYTECEVLLAPTRDRHACMGVSIKEAMAAGKAVIASNSGGIPEAIVDGVNGVILPFDAEAKLDRRQLMTAIVDLLDDPESARRMGDNGRRRAVEFFDNRVCLARQLALVERLIGTP